MIDFRWDQEIIENVIELADCIELLVAFSDDTHGGHLTKANFINQLQSELVNNAVSFSHGDEIDDFNTPFEDAISLIERRASWLGETYPFKCEHDEIYFAPSDSKKHYLSYLFLLACSSHNRIPPLAHNLRIQFENLCKEAMRALFPDWAEVLLFSQNSDDRKQKFGWPAIEAIPKLAEKLNTIVYSDQELSKTQQEFGIDLIAICSFEDALEYPFFAFAQCTVSKEWWNKKHEAKPSHALSGFLRLDVEPPNFFFIPHFPRRNGKKWSESRNHTINCILCDRYRICRLLEKSTTFNYKNIPAPMRDIFNEIQKYLPLN